MSFKIAVINKLIPQGVTGAGKTTLLDVLADRVSFGNTTGDIRIDGVSRDASFPRKIGYAQQEDIHLATTTVREALEFSAALRQSDKISVQDKLSYVENIIDILDMTPFADAIIGVPGDGQYTSHSYNTFSMNLADHGIV